MKKTTLTAMIVISLFLLIFTGCNRNGGTTSSSPSENSITSSSKDNNSSISDDSKSSSHTESSENKSSADSQSYRQISSSEAQEMMKTEKDYIILDVRTESEYNGGHIPNAICIPNESITDIEPSQLPDKDQLILVYCRSGRRSKEAAAKLAAMGYTNIVEFGGIIDWKGETVK